VNNDTLATWFKAVMADMAQYGEAALRLRVEDESRTLAMLRRGDVLGAITHEQAPVSGCVSEYLGTMRYVAVSTPEIKSRFITEMGPAWQQMPLVIYGPQDAILDRAMRDRDVELHVIRGRVSQIPTSEAYLEAVRIGLGWGVLAEIQVQQSLDSAELVALDGEDIEVDLDWRRVGSESYVLEPLTCSVVSAARAALPHRK